MEKLIAPGASSTQSSANSPNSKERTKLILRCTLAIFTAYRADSYGSDEHAEGYKANLKAVLGQYPDDVIIHISDPRTGIQRAAKWPPTISEIVTACEVHMQHTAKLKRLANWGKAQAQERLMLEPPRENRPTAEELKAKYGENYGLKPPQSSERKPVPAPPWDKIIQHYQADSSRLQRLIQRAEQYREDRGDATP